MRSGGPLQGSDLPCWGAFGAASTLDVGCCATAWGWGWSVFSSGFFLLS